MAKVDFLRTCFGEVDRPQKWLWVVYCLEISYFGKLECHPSHSECDLPHWVGIAGTPKMPYRTLVKMVRKTEKTDGTKPSAGAMCEAAREFHTDKEQRGKPQGSTKTTKQEDKLLLATFKKLRPPGHGLTSKALHQALPKKLSKKISPRTCRRRLAEKGYLPQKKLSKTDPGVQVGRGALFTTAHNSKISGPVTA